MQQLVAAKVPLGETDDKGDQAIHYAAAAGCLEGITLMTDNGVFKCVPGTQTEPISQLHSYSEYVSS